MLCVVCSVHWVFYSVLFSTGLLCSVLGCSVLCCSVLLWCSASAVVCSLYKFSSAKNSSQLALCSVLCAVLSVAAVSVGLGLFNVLRTAFAFSGISNTQNECQPGRHTQAYTGRRQSQSASQPETAAAAAAASSTVRRKRRHWQCICICVSFACVCVSVFRSFGTFARYVSLACSLYVRKAEATAQHNAHTPSHWHTYTYTQYVCIWLWYWPGRAFIVCVAEQKFCCSLYEHTATAVAAAARASSWAVAGHMKWWWWGGGGGWVRVRPTATSTEHGRLPACLLGLPCAKRFAPNSHAVEWKLWMKYRKYL